MPLTLSDPHHWAPVPAVVEWLTNRLSPDARVLEVGPGHAPFFRADTFVDFAPWPIQGVPPDKLVKCDLAEEPLPFADKSFDFIYCRHCLEDMYNPFPLIREMERVGKSGYIETPSPICELTRGVDGGAPHYRGYNHHRFIVWSNGNGLRFVSKYPIIEYLDINDAGYADLLRTGARYWNTYHLWTDQIFYQHVQSPIDFIMPQDYGAVLTRAASQSKMSTDGFWRNIPTPTTVPNLLKSA